VSHEEFIRHFEEILECPKGTLSVPEQFEEPKLWDSVAIIAAVAFVDEHFGQQLSRRDLEGCSTINDLFNLVHGRTAKNGPDVLTEAFHASQPGQD
jgi:acyl carrier protein